MDYRKTLRYFSPHHEYHTFFSATFAVSVLLQLFILEEGAERACPEISNITTLVTAFSSPLVTPEPQEAAPLGLCYCLGIKKNCVAIVDNCHGLSCKSVRVVEDVPLCNVNGCMHYFCMPLYIRSYKVNALFAVLMNTVQIAI